MSRRLIHAAALFGTLTLLPLLATAAPVSVDLRPGQSSVAIRTYGLGLLPLDGRFTRFQGRFTYDPAAPARCAVTLQAEVSSLAMSSAAFQQTVLGPEFLDAAQFPTLGYRGACEAGGMAGELTMHGVTRPFALALTWRPDAVTAVGRLQRGDWGMTGGSLLAGRTVRITVVVPLPESAGQPGDHPEAGGTGQSR